MSKYIDKDELWERLKTRMVHHIVTNTLFNTIKAVIDGMPTIEVEEPKRGVWIKKEHLVPLARDADPLEWDKYDEKTHSELEEYWHCSECDYEGDRHFRPLWNYCPNCGARME